MADESPSDFRRRLTEKFLEIIKKDEPPSLYHYTTMEGLAGIISNGFVRATNAFYLNDASEIVHGFDIFEACLEERFKLAKNDPVKSGVLRTAFGDLPAYVFCLTRKNNDLSQWRAYGKDGGVAIEFDTNGLKRLKVQGRPAERAYSTLQQAIYDDKEKMDYAQFVFDNLKTEEHGAAADFEKRLKAFCSNVIWYVPSFKNKAFESEEEFRLVFRLTGEEESRCCDFYVRSGLLVPYCRVGPTDSALLPIKSVWIGPRGDGARNKDSVKLLLRKYKYDPDTISIVDSEIPVRPNN